MPSEKYGVTPEQVATLERATEQRYSRLKGAGRLVTVTGLSDPDKDAFLALLESSAEPNAALKKAARRYKKQYRVR